MIRVTVVNADARILTDARTKKALEILDNASRWEVTTIRHNGKEKVVYQIPGSNGSTYTTNINACSCPDFTRRFRFQRASYGRVNKHLACKHMLAARLFATLANARVANG